MPLLKNKFQPFFPDPDTPAEILCGNTFCNLVAAGDIIRQQWYQTPCSGNLVEDPLFESVTLGPELVTNGTFTGSAAGWTLDAGWSYGTNDIINLSGPNVLATQTGLGLVAGTVYQVQIDFSATVVGSFAVNLGAGAGKVSSAPITETGSYTFILAYNDTDDEISIESLSAGFNGTRVDNVSVKELTTTDWETSGIWALSNEFACKSEAGTGLLYNLTSDYIELGDYYVATVQVSGVGGGYVRMYVDDGTGSTQSNIQANITANGLYTYYFTALQDGVIGFEPSSDFTGCISSPTVHALRNDYPFQLIDPAGDSHDISSFASYDENKVTINVDLAQLLSVGEIEGYGCYTIHIFDACLVSGDNILTDGDFDLQAYDQWQPGPYLHQYNWDGTGLEFVFEPLEGPTLLTNGDFSGGTTGWTGFGADWTEAGAATHVVGNTTPLTQGVVFDPLPPFPIGLFAWFTLDVTGRTAGSFTVGLDGQLAGPFTANDTIVLGFTMSIGDAHTFSINPTTDFDGTIDNIALHQTTNPWQNFPAIYHVPATQLVTGNWRTDYDIISNLVDGQTGVVVSLGFTIPFGTYGSLTTGTGSDTITGYTSAMGQTYWIAGKFNVAGGYFKVGRIKIDDIALYMVEPFEALYTSECFDFQATHSGTKVLTAWCDQDSLGSTPDDDLGFVSTSFLLQMRMRVRSLNAVVDTTGNNAFTSDGNAAVKYAQLEKYWELRTDYISDAAHTALSGMIRCDHFTIGDTGEEDTEYLAKMEDYAPAWRSGGDYDLASATITIRKKEGGMKFMRHV